VIDQQQFGVRLAIADGLLPCLSFECLLAGHVLPEAAFHRAAVFSALDVCASLAVPCDPFRRTFIARSWSASSRRSASPRFVAATSADSLRRHGSAADSFPPETPGASLGSNGKL